MTQQQVGGVIVLFGGTGDLAKKSILPALHQLFQRGKLSKYFAVLGASRKKMTDQEYRDFARQAIADNADKESIDEEFFQHIFYQSADNTKLEDFNQLSESIQKVAKEFDADHSFVYYYSIMPSLYDETTTHLKKSGILDLEGSHRVAVEKPFGENLASAKEYYELLEKAFDDEQIYLIDHFLGMSSLQNILTSRYYNPALEAIWNRDYIEQVQISLPEDFSIGTRGSFYDENGALLDMFQNHILQILTFVAMDLPDDINEAGINEKKLALLKNVPSFKVKEVKEKVVRGQYDSYRDEEDVPEDSLTETYIAIQLEIDSERWQGVPFYVRTGKSVAENHNTVDVLLKSPLNVDNNKQNRITFSLMPQMGISSVVNQKHPTEDEELLTTVIGPDKETMEKIDIPQPYEELVFDILKGTKRHISTYDQVKEQWRITDSIREAWEELPQPTFPNYETGAIGPKEAEELLTKKGHTWIYRK